MGTRHTGRRQIKTLHSTAQAVRDDSRETCRCAKCGRFVAENSRGVFDFKHGDDRVTFAGNGSATVGCHCGMSTTFLVSPRPRAAADSQ